MKSLSLRLVFESANKTADQLFTLLDYYSRTLLF